MIVLDIETIGIDPQKHSIVSLGAVDLENPDNQFYEECRAEEGAEIMQEALDINGFTREEITNPDKQSVTELLRQFLVWCKDCEERTVGGHNVHYDLEIINNTRERNGVAPLKDHGRGGTFHDRVVDLHSLAWMSLVSAGEQLPKDGCYSGLSSDFIFDYVGIEKKRDTHNALEDAKLTAEAISRLLYDRPLFDEFK